MRMHPSLASALLAACSATAADLPSEDVVDAIEQKLSLDPCIGSLDRWSRRFAYGFDPETGDADRSSIAFLFQEAGKYEFREGRFIVTPDKFITVDDRPYRIAAGTYTPETQKLELSACGPNI